MVTRTWIVNKFAGEGGETREVRHDWPDDCYIQGGHNGVVFKTGFVETITAITKDFTGEAKNDKIKPAYKTAYFEAFPKGKDECFIRGEGKNLDEAEDNAWKQYERIRACPHDVGFDPRNYKNGYGFCKGCGMGRSNVIPPSESCHVCGKKTYWSSNDDGTLWGCEEHPFESPLLKWIREG